MGKEGFTMKNKYQKSLALIVMSLLILLVFNGVSNTSAYAEVPTGDAFLFSVENNYRYSYENYLLTDYLREDYSYRYNHSDAHTVESLYSIKILNANSDGYEVINANGLRYKTNYEWNYENYYWQLGDWVLDYSDNYVDTTRELWDTWTYGGHNFIYNYTEILFDPLYCFYESSYVTTVIDTLTINDIERVLTLDVYHYPDYGPNGTGYEYTWTSNYNEVNYTVTENYIYDYYYYVDTATGMVVKYISEYESSNYGSFYEYISEYGCFVLYSQSYSSQNTESFLLTYTTYLYDPVKTDACLPFFEPAENWISMDNSSVSFEIPFYMYDESATMKVFYRDPETYTDALLDTFPVTEGPFNYTIQVDNLPYYRGWNHEFRFEATDSYDTFNYVLWVEDDRIIIPDWESQVFFPDSAIGIADDCIFTDQMEVVSDTSWNITTKLYYGPNETDYYTDWYEDFGNSTFDMHIGHINIPGDYYAELTFMDAVGTTDNTTIPVTIYPKGTDIWSPYIGFDWYPGIDEDKPFEYYLGEYSEIAFWVDDENPSHYELYIDDVLFDNGTYNQYGDRFYYDCAYLFSAEGLYNVTAVAYDIFGNIASDTIWVNASSLFEDYEPPLLNINVNMYEQLEYEIGTDYYLEIDLFDANPDFYKIEIDGEIIEDGSFFNGMHISINLNDFIDYNGDVTFWIEAFDKYGNRDGIFLNINAFGGEDPTDKTEPTDENTITLPFNFAVFVLAIIPLGLVAIKYRK